MSVVAHDLTVRYPHAAALALDHVSMRLDPGEFVVVAGPNGSGKSTLFRALLGIADLEAGEVHVGDRRVQLWRREELARQIGALPQREELVFPQRVRDAVLLGRWAHLGALAPVTSDDRRAVDAALERTGLTALAHRGTDTLSGGEWQRVRLARALAGAPRFLLLDEPGTALDLAYEMGLLELLRELVHDGIGVLAITHHLNAAAQYADRVLLLERGTIAAQGASRTVLTAETVSRVFGWPVAVHLLQNDAPTLVPLRTGPAALPPHSNPPE